jgi:hypothetical protein
MTRREKFWTWYGVALLIIGVVDTTDGLTPIGVASLVVGVFLVLVFWITTHFGPPKRRKNKHSNDYT